jgi:hypothetical protein
MATALAGAQPAPAPPAERAEAAAPAQGAPIYEEQNATRTREVFRDMLRQHPSTLAEVLRLDPSLMNDAEYLAPYPALAAFIKAHPEIGRNPRYFLGVSGSDVFRETDASVRRVGIVHDMWVSLLVFSGFVTFVGLLGWVMKTGIDHRRWLRLTKVHTEVHTKLVDRFSSNDDLMAYVQSPAGRRFLESGPAPSEAPAALTAPFGRILGSLQAGSVIVLLGLGLLSVSRYLRGIPDLAEAAPFALMLGTVASAVGVGFLVSSGLAYFVSRRLGLLEHPASSPLTRDA